MYYRKYFAGTIESNSVYKNIQNIATNRSTNYYYNQTDVLCAAIKSTLEEAGIACAYNPEASILNIDGVSIQIYVFNQNGYIGYYANGITLYENSLNGANPFSGLNYKFYVMLKGDVDSVLNIYVGKFSDPACELYGISVGKGTDLKDGEQIHLVASYTNASGTSSLYVIKHDQIFADYKSAIIFGMQLTKIMQLNGNDTEITLVECVAQPGRFKLNNCYFGSASLNNNEFYSIGGEIYYKLSNNILAKCIN